MSSNAKARGSKFLQKKGGVLSLQSCRDYKLNIDNANDIFMYTYTHMYSSKRV